MHSRSFASGDFSAKNPDWYWSRGLHDAHILRTESVELSYNYTQRNPIRNEFIIHLDSSDAMFDTTITSISLFNYKILEDKSDQGGYGDGLDGCYWIQDILRFEKGKFILELIALGEDDFTYSIQFESAKISRI